MHENVPNLDIILLQCIASMTVNNQMFVSMTQEKCALNLKSLLLHMSHELDNLPQDEIRNFDWKQPDARLAYKLAVDILVAKWLSYLFGYVTWPPWQVCFDFLIVLTLCCWNCLLWHVIQYAVQGQCTFLVSTKQTICYWLSLKQYMGLILYPNLVHFHA